MHQQRNRQGTGKQPSLFTARELVVLVGAVSSSGNDVRYTTCYRSSAASGYTGVCVGCIGGTLKTTPVFVHHCPTENPTHVIGSSLRFKSPLRASSSANTNHTMHSKSCCTGSPLTRRYPLYSRVILRPRISQYFSSKRQLYFSSAFVHIVQESPDTVLWEAVLSTKPQRQRTATE